MRATALVFVCLWCVYALTGGGQGYSVDGTFSYEVARSIATDPARDFLVRNRGTLARWGPVVPALGVPFAWVGARLGELAPRRDTIPVDGRIVRLFDWPALGPAGAGPTELRLPVDPPQTVGALRLVTFLSLASELPQDTPVAEVLLLGAAPDAAPLGRAVLRAGVETAEWAYDLPLAERPRHSRAGVAGHWPGNPQANLYAARLAFAVPAPAAAGGSPAQRPAVHEVVVRYVAAAGRLHLQSALVEPAPGAAGAGHEIPGPPTWSAAEQTALFTRFGFSFLDAPLMAGTAALLVPLAIRLGYDRRAGVLLAMAFGLGTLAWPYAKHDFAEPAAGFFALAATALIYAGAPWRAGERGGAAVDTADTADRVARGHQKGQGLWGFSGAWVVPWPVVLAVTGAGVLAALASGSKYTAAWFIPLLAVQIALLWRRRAAGPLAAFLALPGLALVGLVVFTGRAPALWSGWRQGLASGWLDFSPWEGLYGLLLSPGKSLFLYAPPLLLAVAGLPVLLRRHGPAAFVFAAAPLAYLLVYGSKGVWHGGGWGPRYLVPALPFVALWALPVVEALLHPGWLSRSRLARAGAVVLLAAGVLVQLIGVAKHPNRYTVMFRDHILPYLVDDGVAYGGARAEAYWRHFGGPAAGRQLARPSDVGPGEASGTMVLAPAVEGDPPRGLGYLFGGDGTLRLRLDVRRDVRFMATVYACDWDHRGRRQRLTLTDAGGVRQYTLGADFSGCEYLTWPVEARPGAPIEVRLDGLAGDVPVLSGFFFDPTSAPGLPGLPGAPGGGGSPSEAPRRDATTRGAWPGRYGADGYVLFAWRRGGVDVGKMPDYVAGYEGGDRVWLDTGEAELADTAVLYAPAFSPLLAHVWLLGSDAVVALFPSDAALQQRALGSPPWRYLAGLEIHPPHPEYGLGLDFWQGLLRDQFSSHAGMMAVVWTATALLAAGAVLAAAGLYQDVRRATPARRATTHRALSARRPARPAEHPA